MTPSQEAKEYAAANGFTLKTYGKRVGVEPTEDGDTFSGYPAALNYMRRIVSAREQSPVTRGALVAFDIETFPGAVIVKNPEHKNTAQAVFEAVDKRVLEAFTKVESAYSNLAQAVGTIQFIDPSYKVSRKRAQRVRKAQRKERRMEHCSYFAVSAAPWYRAWRVFVDHQLEATSESRKGAIAYVRKFYAGQRGVTVQYV